jgi:sec-independent protein translocase protein TatA
MDVGPAELIIVLLIVLLVFGGAKLPKLARSMGEAASEFRKGLHHITSADDDKDTSTDAKTPAPAEEPPAAESPTGGSPTAEPPTAA